MPDITLTIQCVVDVFIPIVESMVSVEAVQALPDPDEVAARLARMRAQISG